MTSTITSDIESDDIFLDDLPSEMITSIAWHLDIESYMKFSTTSTLFHSILVSNTTWIFLLLSHFPGYLTYVSKDEDLEERYKFFNLVVKKHTYDDVLVIGHKIFNDMLIDAFKLYYDVKLKTPNNEYWNDIAIVFYHDKPTCSPGYFNNRDKKQTIAFLEVMNKEYSYNGYILGCMLWECVRSGVDEVLEWMNSEGYLDELLETRVSNICFDVPRSKIQKEINKAESSKDDVSLKILNNLYIASTVN